MENFSHDGSGTLTGQDRGKDAARCSNLVYPAMTLLAMILLLSSMWAF